MTFWFVPEKVVSAAFGAPLRHPLERGVLRCRQPGHPTAPSRAAPKPAPSDGVPRGRWDSRHLEPRSSLNLTLLSKFRAAPELLPSLSSAGFAPLFLLESAWSRCAADTALCLVGACLRVFQYLTQVISHRGL